MGNRSSGSGNKNKKQRISKNNCNKNTEPNDDWILSCIINLVQSPECSILVDGFIDTHCLIFDPNNSQINNQYTKIHLQYKQMVERLLISKLSKLGITAKQFTETMQKSNEIKINSDINLLQYISAVDNFDIFRNLMTQRNIELEKEAIAYLSQHKPELDQSDANSVDLNNMTEEEQIEWALSDSIAIQKQQQQEIMESLPNYKQYDIVPSAPFLSREPSHTPTNIELNKSFEIISNVNMSEPKRVLLQPLKLKKEDTIQFEGMQNDDALPVLTAESIQNIKLKQSSKYNESILKRKQMILSMRRQKRNEEFKSMKAQGPGWDIDDMNKQSKLPPLHKSLFAKVKEGEYSIDAQSKKD